MTTTEASLQRLEEVVGAPHVRPGTPADAVGGVVPEVVVAPESEEAVAAVLAVANEHALRVTPRGGGTKLSWGGPPRGLDILLSLERLNHLIERSAGDLTLVAEAGMPLEAVQRALAGDRQFLALDAPLAERATLGGIVSANVTGPLRQRYGGVRDQLIGVTLVRPDGKLAKAGGKVVKNVAGYDLMKLLTGAFGTLGVLVRCAFRLYPLSEASGTVAAEVPDAERLRAALVATAGSTLVPAAVSVLAGEARASAAMIEGARPLLAARFATVGAAVREQAESLIRLWQSHGLEPRFLDQPGEAAVWQAAGTSFWTVDGGSALCKATTSMTAVPAVVELVSSRGGSLLAHALAGVSYLRLSGAAEQVVRVIEEVRTGVRAQRGSLVVLDAPESVRQAVDMWGPVDERVLELMRRIKAEFDPRGTCSPGRFVGGI
jgi:glycolate oxidase FAD binding subunit